jgi:biofilm protein TabA
MILDQIKNAHLYFATNAKFKLAFDYLNQIDVNTIPAGKYEIDGKRVFALVQQYNTRRIEDSEWESHRRYIDLQYVVTGVEKFGYANLNNMQQGQYDAAEDFLPLNGNGDIFTLREKCFILLLPEDAHMPGISAGVPAPVKKIIIKISVN